MNLLNVSPLDGRYAKITTSLKEYFSEYAYIRTRVFVELEYLKQLSRVKIISLNSKEKKSLDEISQRFNLKEALKVKKIEEKTKHDVKAIEYYLQEKLAAKKLNKIVSFIHFGLTSTDVDNVALAILMRDYRSEVAKQLRRVLNGLKRISVQNKKTVIVGRTHGQPAVPTTLGKEFANFYYRLSKQLERINKFKFEAKINGAVGNYNAHKFAYPKINWPKFSKDFLKKLGLDVNLYTTQILPYDNLIEYFQILKNTNTILIGLTQDIWSYNMLGIVKLEKSSTTVGSSTMPQKVNPIEFENAEGNLLLTNALIEIYEKKLLISRLQRDLSDSTIMRSFGEMFGHQLIAWINLERGLSMIRMNEQSVKNWEVLAEAVQTYLRTRGETRAYDLVKRKTFGKKLDEEEYRKLVNGKLNLPINNPLKKLKPKDYTGLAEKLVDSLFKK